VYAEESSEAVAGEFATENQETQLQLGFGGSFTKNSSSKFPVRFKSKRSLQHRINQFKVLFNPENKEDKLCWASS